MPADVVHHILKSLGEKQQKVGAVWMTEEEAVEEKRDEEAVAKACREHGVEFRLWADEKYFVDE